MRNTHRIHSMGNNDQFFFVMNILSIIYAKFQNLLIEFVTQITKFTLFDVLN